MDKSKFTPIVITSKAANDDFNDIKMRHLDLVNGISQQALRVKAYKDQQKMEAQQRDQLQMENDSKLKAEQAASQTKGMEMSIKQQELELKKAALTMP